MISTFYDTYITFYINDNKLSNKSLQTQYIQKGCASVERIAYFHAARSAFLQSIIPLDHEDTTPIEAVVFAPSLFPTGMSFNSSHMSHDLSYLPVTPLHTSTDPLVEGTVALISEMAAASSCPDNTLASAMDFVPDSPCSGLVEGTTDDDSPSPCLAEIGHLSGSPILCAHELGDEAYSGGCPDKHKHSSSDGCSGTATSSTMDVTDEKKDFSDQQSDLVVSTYGAPVAVDVPTDCGGGGCPREECEDLKRYLLHEMSQVTAQH
jgi:hypothetical protein